MLLSTERIRGLADTLGVSETDLFESVPPREFASWPSCASLVSDVADEKFLAVLKRIDMFDLVVSMHGLNSFAAESRRSREIEGGTTTVRVFPLDRIIASKRAVRRVDSSE
jgi:hypothetical protein